VLLVPTLEDAASRGLLSDIETLWLDRGYDSDVTRARLKDLGIDDAVIAEKRKKGAAQGKNPQPMGLRWPVERTNSWLSNFGALRRNTDRKTKHRLAQFALAVTFLLTAKLIDWRNRWSPGAVPIR
jgi:transposase